MDREYDPIPMGSKNLSLTKGTVYNVDGPNLVRMIDFKAFQEVRIYFIDRLRIVAQLSRQKSKIFIMN